MVRKQPKERRRYVDMWALPGVHPTNVEFMQKMTTADTQHFTKHMDVVGTVSEQDTESRKWNKTHLIGVRTDIWKPDVQEMARSLEVIREQRAEELRRDIKRSGKLSAAQSTQLEQVIEEDTIMQMQSDDIEKRRLVLKLFKTTSSRVRWCGTIEQVTTTEIHNSIGSRRSLLTMAVLLPRTEFITTIQQNHRSWRWPAVFTFCFFRDNVPYHVILRRRWFCVGADFDVVCENQSLGLIDGRLFGFGSDSYVNLAEHPLSTNSQFVDLLTLFATSVGYHQAMRRSVASRVRANLSGHSQIHVIEDEELRLRHNGRSAA